jgi:regulator of protease activity HflC (stomatin/prohibitin superfamily)
LPDAEEDGTLSASRDAELDRLAAENAALRGQLAEVEAKAKGVGAPDAVARLMKANEDLRNKFINIKRLLNEGIGEVPPPASAVLASPAPFRPLGSAAVGSVQVFRHPGANYAAAVMSTTPLTTPLTTPQAAS